MSEMTCNGRSDGLHALYELMVRSADAPQHSGRPSFAPHLANRELAAFFRDCTTLDPDHGAGDLFLDPLRPDTFHFEPTERMMRDEEKDACIEAATASIRGGSCIYGAEIDILAGHLCDFLDARHVILCSSGTAALIVSLLALDVGPGDEVIIPANSFAATENAVLAVGAQPVVADVRPESHTLDPESVERAVTSRTRVILPVDLHGALSDMDALRDLADKRGLAVLEDACQAIGVTGVGRKAHLATLSFNTYKNFSACGKAGAIMTDEDDLARRAAMISYHGFDIGRKMFKRLPFGLNCLIDNLQAATLLARLPFLSLVNFRRLFLALRYDRAFRELQPSGSLIPPEPRPDHGWHHYQVVLPSRESRDELMAFLDARGVPSRVVYPALTHWQETPLRQSIFKHVHLPVTEDLLGRKLALPLFNGMSLEEQDRVIAGVCKGLKSCQTNGAR